MKMAFLLLGAALMAALLISGCGQSALQTHTASALAVREALNVSANMVEDDMHKKATQAASDESVDTATAEINAHNVIRGYHKAIKLHGDAVTAWQLWVTSLLSAYNEDAEDTDVWRRLAANTFVAYKHLAVEALRHDLRVPQILAPMKAVLTNEE